jgi:hypothetical protein
MHLSDKLVKIDELAATLDRTQDWVKRNWLKLHLEQGMPRKIAVGWAWPRGALERWLEEGADGVTREAQAPEAPTGTGLSAFIANQNTALRDRYAGGRG